jgi:hypothetical protein
LTLAGVRRQLGPEKDGRDQLTQNIEESNPARASSGLSTPERSGVVVQHEHARHTPDRRPHIVFRIHGVAILHPARLAVKLATENP